VVDRASVVVFATSIASAGATFTEDFVLAAVVVLCAGVQSTDITIIAFSVIETPLTPGCLGENATAGFIARIQSTHIVVVASYSGEMTLPLNAGFDGTGVSIVTTVVF